VGPVCRLLAVEEIGLERAPGRGGGLANEHADLAWRPTDVLPVGDRAGEDLGDLVLGQGLDRVAGRDGNGCSARADRQGYDLAGRLLGIGQITADVPEVCLAGDDEVYPGVRSDIGEPLPGDAWMLCPECVGQRLDVVERAAAAVHDVLAAEGILCRGRGKTRAAAAHRKE